MASSTIALQSSDGEKFEVPKEIARKSVTIKTMLEDLGLDDGDDNCEAGSSIIILYFLLKLFFFFLRSKNKFLDFRIRKISTFNMENFDENFFLFFTRQLQYIILLNSKFISFK